MPAKGFREVDIQDELTYIIRNLVSRFKFNGLELDVEREFEINKKRADIVILLKSQRIPILVIETKRKYVERGTFKVDRRIDPFSKAVMGQALCYATLIKKEHNLPATPFIATANPEKLVIFSPIEKPENYVDLKKCEEGDYEGVLVPGAYADIINRYSLYMVRTFKKEDIQKLLEDVIKVWKRITPLKELKWPLGHWLIEHFRIQFIDYLSTYFVTDYLIYKLVNDNLYYQELDKLSKEAGYKNGLVDIIGNNLEHVDRLARMMLYALLNKIIFYKVLERHYRDLPSLKPLVSQGFTGSTEYLNKLNELFEKAIEITQDFEAIFRTGLFDKIILPDEIDCLKTIDATIELLDTVEMEKLSDIIGHIYEKLIPAEERHQMGQFYTPPPIAELIVKWCIKNPDDKVLDPGVGSGTFLIEAYKRLFELKTGKKYGKAYPNEVLHEKILDQLYGFDINPFPLQLTAMNLAIRNTKMPSKEINVILTDFFAIIPGMKALATYTIKTPGGEIRREIEIPKEFDCVIGNPPYTRWGELSEKVQRNINDRIRKILNKYDLRPQAGRRGAEYTMVVFWIIHATDFLKEHGKLGMIVSDSWLQTDYGIRFGRFLADHYKIHTIIDISARVFPVPLIGACIILLEKCSNEQERDLNDVVFAYLDVKRGTIDIDKVLKIVSEKQPGVFSISGSKIIVKVYRQEEIRKSEIKWINFLFNVNEILEKLAENEKIVRLDKYFEPSYGNTLYTYLYTKRIVRTRHAGVGGEEFFYLTKDNIRKYKLSNEYIYPLLPSSKYMKYFTFTEDDWKKLCNRGEKCFLFLAHKPRNQLPKEVLDYIKLGETEIKLKKGIHRGEPVSKARAAEERRRLRKYFFDWYDLGGVIEASIYVARGARYWMRFVLARVNCALDDRILALIPRQGVTFSEIELKALLAYLNSSFSQLQAEVRGRTAGGVALLELDVKPLSDFFIIDVKKLPKEVIERLAQLFDKLEAEARRLGDADTVENVYGTELAKELTGKEIKENINGLFNTVIKEIDYEIAKILNLEDIVEPMRAILLDLVRRRLARAREAKPTALKGDAVYIETAKKRKRKSKRSSSRRGSQTTLDIFFTKTK